jgi:enamine deaminase RidA (YjgF/YER057c/UK114 family)
MIRPLAAALALFPSAAFAQTVPAREAIVPPGKEWARDVLHFSPAVRSGDLIFLSGVAIRLADNQTEADKEAALDDGFRDIETVLKASGASWDDVVQITSYHTDFTPGAAWDKQLELFRKVKDRYVRQPYPAWTSVGVTRLWTERYFVEIQVTARVPKR